MLPTKFEFIGWGVSEEKIKMWKVNGRRTTSDGKSSHCLWQGELKMEMFIKKIIYELNKRIDEIKNHSMNNSFLYTMKKKINSS